MIKDINANDFDLFKFIKENDCVLFLYPKMGKSGEFLPANLKDKEGMTGCTLQTKGYEAIKDEFEKIGFKLIAIGSQTPQNQAKFKNELGATIMFLNDTDFMLEKQFNANTFTTSDDNKFYFRQTLVFKNSKLVYKQDVTKPQDDAKNVLDFCKSLI